jgi:hypothetical protein
VEEVGHEMLAVAYWHCFAVAVVRKDLERMNWHLAEELYAFPVAEYPDPRAVMGYFAIQELGRNDCSVALQMVGDCMVKHHAALLAVEEPESLVGWRPASMHLKQTKMVVVALGAEVEEM